MSGADDAPDRITALLHAAATRRLTDVPAPTFTGGYALTVVMAANGYPGSPKGRRDPQYRRGRSGRRARLHAGTARADGAIVAAGGRVLNVTATGKSVTSQARLCRGRQARFPERLLPPRHQLARSRARGALSRAGRATLVGLG